MKPVLVCCCLLSMVFPTVGRAAEVEPLTLEHAYALSRRQSEMLAIDQELIHETEGRVLRTVSALMPKASFEMSEKRQDGSGGSAFTLRSVPERKFVFTQPIFSGFKEFAALAAVRAQRRQRTHEYARADALLLVDVADAFYLLRASREDLGVLEMIRTVLAERIEELSSRERIGRSPASERVSAETQLRLLLAELDSAQGQERVARTLLGFLIGRPPEEIKGVVDPDPALTPLDDASVYLAKVSSRPDVLAAEDAWKAQRQEINVARADFFPNVNLESNYYTKRVGASRDVDWDVLVKMEVPIFQGGDAVGAFKEATSRERQARLALARARRLATQDLQDAYTTARTAYERTATLTAAVQSAEDNYQLQLKDYHMNLVNYLDLLQALHTLQETHRNLIQARAEAKRLYWHLKAATGETR